MKVFDRIYLLFLSVGQVYNVANHRRFFMVWLKRIGLFLIVNILVTVTISFVLNILGVGPYLSRVGMNYSSLIIFCLVWGMGGAFISLALSKYMAKWMMGVQIISPETNDPALRELLHEVHTLARTAELSVMPEVGVYDSPDVNAFATGPTKSSSLVAVSTGLLHRMNKQELRGVLGHEIAHIANGDMVTMTLIQGIVNAFAMFLARAIAFAITSAGSRDDDERGSSFTYFAIQMVLEIVFMILGSMVVAWFSRYREYRADKGGARLAGNSNMILALQRLQRAFETNTVEVQESASVQAMKISSRPSRFLSLFSTHPPLAERIKRLQKSTYN
jgi:heat shock protein HtpX